MIIVVFVIAICIINKDLSIETIKGGRGFNINGRLKMLRR